ncbi:pyridoxal-dependent decarboxylase [Bacterioplanes sanyensis]|uniref:Pyridoxal-dependent decarboxylase n=1 Tax=Bacterioplanes sanyensis TaxID=1249553 RepID=A0A222FEN4_9GAMM|nr:aspartate aminotransferase family protein [Bacterioplanes sanyensis]ASP37545.1 pyridoxal-dependent decarboxylase [Bacterioplanes sanyensis]
MLMSTTPASVAAATPNAEQFLFSDQALLPYQAAMSEAIQRVCRQLSQQTKPTSGVTPAQLQQQLQQVDLTQPLADLSQVLDELQTTYLNDAVYFHHPHYMAHLNCPIVYPALVAEVISGAINTSVDTWDQSAGATLIEQHLIDWFCQHIGWAQQADGIFTSGGTQSNLMGLLLARDHFCEQQLDHCVKTQGLPAGAGRLRIFASEVSHFSVKKSAALLGLGHNAVVPVACDQDYRMCPLALREALHQCQRQDLIPMAVVATQGTTDFGSFDPLPQLAPICREWNLWLHADAAYGGGLLLSNQYRQRLAAIELADSVSIDFHKSFFQPVSCSAFLLRNRQWLKYAGYHADYLNPRIDAAAGIPNLVDKSLQTTRRFDALKLWLSLRWMGPNAIGELFDKAITLTQQVYDWMSAECDDIELLHQPGLSTLVFRFYHAEASDAQLDECNRQIRRRLFDEGRFALAATKVNGRGYLKFTFLNATTQLDQVQQAIAAVQQIGRQTLQPLDKPQEACA